jgi:glycerol-3-phosphate O-acyltransferase/dihydroxyacetone phosphate acyltransferase
LKFLYYIVKPLVNIFLRIYYKFDIKGLENIPVGKPVILAPNHVNAFMDPVLIGMSVRQEIRFFARGDVFKGAVAKWALDQLNISPMYRMQEGYSEVKKNDKTFEECRQLLTDDKIILMFPEGLCIQERRLRPLKKGLARIVFQTATSFDFSKDILIVPIGINYSDAKNFRSKVVLDFGKPISTLAYKESYKADNVKAINEFTKILEEKMTPQLVIIKNPANEDLVAAIEEMYLQQWLRRKGVDDKDLVQQYEGSKEIAEMINRLDGSHPEIVSSLRTKTTGYIQQLKSCELRDHLLDASVIEKMNFGTFLLESFTLYLGAPIYAIALLLNFPPYYLAKRYSDQTIKNVEFYASVYANLAMILWLVYFGIQLLIVGLVFHSWKLLGAYALLISLLGYFTVYFYPVKKKILGRWRLLRLVRKTPDLVSRLARERAVIFEEIELAIITKKS